MFEQVEFRYDRANIEKQNWLAFLLLAHRSNQWNHDVTIHLIGKDVKNNKKLIKIKFTILETETMELNSTWSKYQRAETEGVMEWGLSYFIKLEGGGGYIYILLYLTYSRIKSHQWTTITPCNKNNQNWTWISMANIIKNNVCINIAIFCDYFASSFSSSQWNHAK